MVDVGETEVVDDAVVMNVAKVGKKGKARETFVDFLARDESSFFEGEEAEGGMAVAVDLNTFDCGREGCLVVMNLFDSSLNVTRGESVAPTNADFSVTSTFVSCTIGNVVALAKIVPSTSSLATSDLLESLTVISVGERDVGATVTGN